mmetsp:Transcript_73057/g.205221  ORF Transcript_73057/g.205221 Transcript_73057/m.205221 type:complete len:236 (+) Transcript_73057:125-832(+)
MVECCEAPCWQVAAWGAQWFLLLGGTNLVLRAVAERHPEGILASQVKGGVFDMKRWQYVLSSFGQGLLQPFFYCTSIHLSGGFAQWWYGADMNIGVVQYLAYSVGYFLQDAVVNWRGNSSLVLLHHIVSMSVACWLSTGAEWVGLLLTCAQCMEFGSLLVAFGDLGVVPRRAGLMALLLTSLLPFVVVALGVLIAPPRTLQVWSISFSMLVAAFIRCREAQGHLGALVPDGSKLE